MLETSLQISLQQIISFNIQTVFDKVRNFVGQDGGILLDFILPSRNIPRNSGK